MSNTNRRAYFISDGTGITAETLGRSILSQFPSIAFEMKTRPYIDTEEKAREVRDRINLSYEKTRLLPIVFDTIVREDLRAIVNEASAINLDIYEGLIGRLAGEIGTKPKRHMGGAHSDVDSDSYKSRIEAVHFALDNDDGATTRHYDQADIILVGLSRSGKTPTSLFLALQFGIRAANYPITEEDLDTTSLPAPLKPYKDKLFGLVIDTDRLVAIRQGRKANSRYASLAQCQFEQRAISGIYRINKIPTLNISEMSVEEIATRIMQIKGFVRKIL